MPTIPPGSFDIEAVVTAGWDFFVNQIGPVFSPLLGIMLGIAVVGMLLSILRRLVLGSKSEQAENAMFGSLRRDDDDDD